MAQTRGVTNSSRVWCFLKGLPLWNPHAQPLGRVVEPSPLEAARNYLIVYIGACQDIPVRVPREAHYWKSDGSKMDVQNSLDKLVYGVNAGRNQPTGFSQKDPPRDKIEAHVLEETNNGPTERGLLFANGSVEAV